MRAIFTGLVVTSGILAICMGATDYRGGALMLSAIAGVCAAMREISRA